MPQRVQRSRSQVVFRTLSLDPSPGPRHRRLRASRGWGTRPASGRGAPRDARSLVAARSSRVSGL